MSASGDERDRQVVPRWRLASVTAALGEASSLATREGDPIEAELAERVIAKRVDEWEATKTLPFLGDLLATAVAVGDDDEANRAANEVVTSDGVPGELRRLAEAVLSPITGPADVDEGTSAFDQARTTIREVRAVLRRSPRDALAWLDFARAQVSTGSIEKALRAGRTALALAPTNRTVVRGVARLLVEAKLPDEAHQAILDSGRTKTDPWLMASEIATAAVAEIGSVSAQAGRRLLDDNSIAPFHRSELASAVGTLDFSAGRVRPAKRLFRQSLQSPTDNALAQAEWIEPQLGALGVEVDLSVPFSFEARARSAAESEEWDLAMESSHKWFHDEPFSLEAAIFGSWLASTGLEDWETAVRIAQEGLKVHAMDPMLLNNLAFSLLQSDSLAQASEVLAIANRQQSDEDHRPFLLATNGLLAYRLGDVEGGRALYAAAIASATGGVAKRIRAVAQLYQSREEARLHTDLAESFLSKALSAAEGVSGPEVHRLAEELKAWKG